MKVILFNQNGNEVSGAETFHDNDKGTLTQEHNT